jgi:hypothetical protein
MAYKTKSSGFAIARLLIFKVCIFRVKTKIGLSLKEKEMLTVTFIVAVCLILGVVGYIMSKTGYMGAIFAIIGCAVGFIVVWIRRVILAKIHTKRWKKMRDEIMAEDPWL